MTAIKIPIIWSGGLGGEAGGEALILYMNGSLKPIQIYGFYRGVKGIAI